MKSRRGGNVRKLAPVANTERKDGPFLPAWKAFMVQLSRDSGVKPEIFQGRIEHLNSGRRARFESQEALLASLKEMLEMIERRGS